VLRGVDVPRPGPLLLRTFREQQMADEDLNQGAKQRGATEVQNPPEELSN
jgi:hypothetical protein